MQGHGTAQQHPPPPAPSPSAHLHASSPISRPLSWLESSASRLSATPPGRQPDLGGTPGPAPPPPPPPPPAAVGCCGRRSRWLSFSDSSRSRLSPARPSNPVSWLTLAVRMRRPGHATSSPARLLSRSRPRSRRDTRSSAGCSEAEGGAEGWAAEDADGAGVGVLVEGALRRRRARVSGPLGPVGRVMGRASARGAAPPVR